MRKIKHLTLALSLLLSAGIVFGQAEKSASISNQLVLKNQHQKQYRVDPI